MKKIVVVLLAVCLLFASSRNVSHASTSVPTALWNLVPTAYMEQIGIFTDPVNHRGYYTYSAYFSNSTLYSNYYFQAPAANEFVIHGHRISSINQHFYVTMRSKFGTNYVTIQIAATTTLFIFDYGSYPQNLTNKAYFYFDGTNGAQFSVNGTLETYY